MKKHNGFTLIEVLLYLGLFGIIFSGLLVSVFAIIESIGRGDASSMAQIEGDFLLAKIGSSMNGASSFEVLNPSNLKINSPKAAVFKQNGNFLEINNIPLNNSISRVENLEFRDTGAEGLSVSFILQVQTREGRVYKHGFSRKYPIRK